MSQKMSDTTTRRTVLTTAAVGGAIWAAPVVRAAADSPAAKASGLPR